jgi:hypothetical protein
MAIFAWACVAFPRIRVHWKGRNHAPLSLCSKVVSATAITAWCFGVFGFYPLFFGMAFIACVMFLFFQSSQDGAAFNAAKGITRNERRIGTPAQFWLALCFFDALVFTVSLYAFLRDLRYPSHTEEQHLVHIMGIFYLVSSGIGAVYLYVKRPPKGSRE